MVGTCVDAVIESGSSLQNNRYLIDRRREWLLDEILDENLDFVIVYIPYLRNHWRLSYRRRKWLLECLVELRIMKMFLWCSVSCDSDAYLRSIVTSIESIWQDAGTIEDLDRLRKYHLSLRQKKKAFRQLAKKILFSKKKIKKYCEHLVSKSLTWKPLTSHEIQQILDAIIMGTNHMVSWVADEILPVKNQIETIKQKLVIFRDLVEFTGMRCVDGKALGDFNFHVLTWAKRAACLMFLYREALQYGNSLCGLMTCGFLGRNVSKKKRLYNLVTDLLHNVNPTTTEFIDMCFAVIKLTKSSDSHIILFEEFVPTFVDFLLQNLMFTSNDDFRMLREGLIYLITFLAGPPVNYGDKSELIFFQNQINAVLIEASHLISHFGMGKVDFTSCDTALAKLVEMIDQVKGQIDKYCVQLPHSSWSYFPRINGLGFVESLLVYLQGLEKVMSSHPKLVSSLKHQIFVIKKELASLRPFLQNISNLLNEHKELKDLWEEIICVAYQAELSIKQSFLIDRPLCLSYVLQKIKAIQSKVTRVKGNKIYKTGVLSSLSTSSSEVITSVATTEIYEELVGFKEDAEELIDRLTRGTKRLDIVSIVGMGGIGKTTLAKKLYKEPFVTYHFHKRAFCTVSQVYQSKSILLDILNHLSGIDDNLRNMTEEDLADRLRKSLKGCTYFIVLDDIWDMNAWISVKDSFPDDHNGSRVMFTTRINDLSFLAKPNCSPHKLRFLTIDESWDLLQQKIFHKDPCPPYLSEVGRLIAKSCKGLPLSIVVIAGLLAKSKRSLSWWQKVADNLASYAFSEGCRDILELSYRLLPEAFKSCFLYLGAFPEDTNYRARDITKLWAAERFLPDLDRSGMEKAAKEYLNYLGDRSLLIVTERSLAGNIKLFQLHDVIREFCISKAQEENLLCLVNGVDDNFSMPLTYDGYRICIQGACRSFIDANSRGPAAHSLLCFGYNEGIKLEGCSMSSLVRNFRLIQVLKLQPVKFLDFPTGITMLVHLRYLALTFGSISSHVPPTISNLRSLETLFLLWEETVHLPATIWEMQRLRHLEFPSGCCFDGLHDGASEAFPQLPDLETVGVVLIKDGEEGEELLRRLPNVRKLSLSCMRGDLPERLVHHSKLESLSIKWWGDNINSESSLSLPSGLRKLSLTFFRLPCRELSTIIGLNKLSCLQVLELVRCRFDGNKWDVEDEEFIGLKRLELHEVEIEYWNAITDSFPCLEKLVLKHCHILEEVPPCFGEVQTLRALEVSGCSEGVETSAVQIQQEQLDMGNDSLELVMEK